MTFRRRALAIIGFAVLGLATSARAQDATGTITAANGAVTFSLANVPSAVVQLTGTWAGGPVVFEATVDGGSNWSPISATSPTTGARQAQVTSNGIFVIRNDGYTAARVRAVTWGSGTAAVAVTRGFITTMAPVVQAVQTTQTVATQLGSTQLAAPCNALTRAAGQCK